MIDKNSTTIGRLLLQITEYLNRNPHAADTLAGIESWWLSGAAHNISSSDLESAIHILVKRGILQCNEQPDGTKTYSRAEHADCANEFDRVGG